MNKLNSNPLYRFFVPKSLRTRIWKNYLQKKILSHYESSKDEEIQDLIKNIRKNGLKIILKIDKQIDKQIDEKMI